VAILVFGGGVDMLNYGIGARNFQEIWAEFNSSSKGERREGSIIGFGWGGE